MLSYQIEVSEAEARLIHAIREIKYGEIYGAEIALGERSETMKIFFQERELLMEIRSGQQYIDVLYVHEGRPVYMEVDRKIHEYRGRQKIKFPTE